MNEPPVLLRLWLDGILVEESDWLVRDNMQETVNRYVQAAKSASRPYVIEAIFRDPGCNVRMGNDTARMIDPQPTGPDMFVSFEMSDAG